MILVHHTIKYKIKKQNNARNVRIKDTIKDDQFVKNKGDSIPFSVNRGLYDAVFNPSIEVKLVNILDKSSMSIFTNSNISNMIFTCSG